MKNKKLIPVVVILIVIVGGLVLARFKGGFRYAGTVEATRIDVPARVASVVALKAVEEGQVVNQGRELYRLGCEDIQILAESSQRDFQRAERLFKSGSMPQEAYEHLKSKKDDATLKAQWCSIKAPSDGTILTTYRETGEWVSPGTKMLTLADLREVWAIFYVEQPKVSQLKLESTVVGTVPELAGRRFEGRIVKINSEAEFTPKNVQTREERTRLVYGVKVQFKNPDAILKAGMTLYVDFN